MSDSKLLRAVFERRPPRARAAWLVLPLVASVLAAWSPPAARAGWLFDAAFVMFPAGGEPASLAIADIDEDGDPDLVFAVQSSGTASPRVSVARNLGDGSFAPRSDLPPLPEGYLRAVQVDDFDGDGHADVALIVDGSMSKPVVVLFGRGDGTFEQPVECKPVDDPMYLTAGDLDADGASEILVGDWTSNTVSMLSASRKRIVPAPAFDPGCASRAMALVDLDGDGKLDLVIGSPQDSISVLRGDGRGGFGQRISSPAKANTSAIRSGDIDRDGHADLVLVTQEPECCPTPTHILYLRGRGDGAFAPAIEVTDVGRAGEVAISDVNGDGRPDLILGCGDNVAPTFDALAVLPGRGDGTFDPRIDVPAGQHWPWAPIAAGDLDGDGKIDLASAGEGTVDLFHGNGDCTFGPDSRFTTAPNPNRVCAADLDRDSKLDLVVGSGMTSAISILGGLGNGKFAEKKDIETAGVPTAFAIGNLDPDDVPDLAVASSWSFVVSLFHGDGSGGFLQRVDMHVPSYLGEIAIADVNRDGHEDLVATALIGEVGLIVFAGQGDGTFGPGTLSPIGNLSGQLALGDLNEDGAPDAVVLHTWSDTVSVMLGNGDGTFRPGGSLVLGPILSEVTTADLDRDGHLDLVVGQYGAGESGSGIWAALGRGDGTFATPRFRAAALKCLSVAVGDFDANGSLDLAGSFAWNYSTVVFPGRGDGSFGEGLLFGTGDYPGSLAPGDFDRDGRLDLAVALTRESRVFLLHNQGVAQPPLAAALDIRPGSCPNPLNPASRGVVPAALLGARDFDVRNVVVSSLRLEGVPPLRSSRDDVSGPSAQPGLCACAGGPDGFADLVMYFDTEALIASLGPRVLREARRLVLTGTLEDGTAFEAGDCVEFVGGGHAPLEPLSGPRAAIQCVRFELAAPGPADLVVCDVMGRVVRRVAGGPHAEGAHEARWDSTGLPSGIYFYRFTAAGRVETQKLLLLR